MKKLLLVSALFTTAVGGLVNLSYAGEKPTKTSKVEVKNEKPTQNGKIVLTLNKAIEMALKDNLEIKAERLKAKEKYYDYKAAKGYLWPQLNFSYFFSRTNNPPYSIMFRMNNHNLQFPRVQPQDTTTAQGVFMWTAQSFQAMENFFNNPGSSQQFNAKFEVQVPIWMGGKVRNMIKGKFFEWKSQELLSQRKAEDVAFQVADTYLKVLYAKAAVRATQTALKDVETHLKLVEKMHKVGMALYSDVLRVKVYYQSVKQKNIEAKNNLYIAKKALALLLNQQWKPEQLSIKGELYCPSPQEVEKSLNQLKRWAIEYRKDLNALKEGLQAVKYYKKATWGTYLPDFVAFGEYDLYDVNRFANFRANSWMVGIGLQWKLFDGLNAFNKVKMLKEKERELKTMLDYAQKGIRFQIDKAYKDYQTAYAKVEEAKTKIKEAEESLRIVTNRYKQGLARIVDLLDVQSQLDMARFEEVQALYQCNKAYLELYNNAGKLLEVVK
jgi:outer membrane protein TolC